MAEPTVKLIPYDDMKPGAVQTLRLKGVPFSTFLSDALIQGEHVVVPEEGIECLEVNSKCLALIIKFLEYRCDHPQGTVKMPLETKAGKATLKDNGLYEWFQTFIMAIPMKDLFELMKASHAMKVDTLTDLCAMRMALFFGTLTHVQKLGMLRVVGMDRLENKDEKEVRDDYMWLEDEPDRKDTEGVTDIDALKANNAKVMAYVSSHGGAAAGGAAGGK